MKTNLRVSNVVRTLAAARETKLGFAQVVDAYRQPLANLSQVRRQQPWAMWCVDHAHRGGKPKGKPARRLIDPRSPRAGRLERSLGVSGRRLASSARRTASVRRFGRTTLFALANGRSARPAITRTAGFGGAIRRAG